MYFSCIASSTEVDKNGLKFSPEALKQFEGIKGRIFASYDSSKPPVGTVHTAKVDGNKLRITGTILPQFEKQAKEMYVAPSCRMLDGYVDENKDTIVRSLAPMAYGLVLKHADPLATKVEELK
ncbi:hypothetical protein AG74_59 [Vibrio phage AG74]|uniref:Uncharacterized protein n=1 Tax=Vibrio phage AG74 TaxID=2736261 RepID=A0A6M9Z1U0_9CAUD|nr:hypothetical protein KNV06_gp059 [Vibrio phage AG74]QKN84918.1 hypothetical protein AG74_59 [Vibrio phage AG74]